MVSGWGELGLAWLDGVVLLRLGLDNDLGAAVDGAVDKCAPDHRGDEPAGVCVPACVWVGAALKLSALGAVSVGQGQGGSARQQGGDQ